MIDRFLKALQFLAWPVATGILLSVVVLQYQQLQQLSERTPLPVARETPSTGLNSFSEAIKRASPSVVSINATSVNIESIERAAEDRVNLYLGERASLGSGVIVSDKGYILTNLHVVDTLFDAFDTEVTLNDGRKKPATVIAWDEDNDLAILHINMDNLTPISIGDETAMEVGDIVFAIGYPRNIGQSVSQGIISALNNSPDSSSAIIQTDAAINPGNSGGALIDAEGKLIGINSSIFSESGNFEGIGFATPVSLAVAVLDEMVEQAIEANSGYLGVITGEALNAQSSQLFFGADHIRGMLVENVDNGGAAQRAGIQPGDVITKVEDTTVVDAQNIMLEIRNKKPGDTINIEIYRAGQTLSLPTVLGFGQAIIIEP
ncbi:MAG: PDZ domain-containing protein [Gammaproteobacteria bacterium]|jgi:serine protease DegS|nr:PDZ domain-containing protein [Gammaproteobacteria bacterium]MBT3859927.1 PDZ domain-containing protein [Gammaproteobacteria bacterium]MBT3986389.1 PDZ domain-containing protein [Gammaproteobacteria bacterium]MBT4582949.1 PDZ domain-containing protein [Gammaproteobacteria bacterium]MBT4658292.1 PDZ domain-containing protein [Gammaproteobacteria bacterium]